MAHEIGATDTQFSVGETPWHGLGTVLPEAPTIPDALRFAGLDWKVNQEEMYLGDGKLVLSHKANVRSTDGMILGVVGDRYVPLQNADAFKPFQPFLDAGMASLETAGSLQDGKRIWALARVLAGGSDVGIVGDDAIRKYVLLSHSHDGSLAVRYGFTPVRVVCANTLAMAHSSKQSQFIRMKHTQGLVGNLEKVTEIMNLANSSFEATAEQYRQLARYDVNQSDLRKYVKTVLGFAETKDEDMSSKGENQVCRVLELFETGKGHQLQGVRGTAWAAYNAVTEYLSHEVGYSADGRYNSLWFGQGGERNKLALEEALKLCA